MMIERHHYGPGPNHFGDLRVPPGGADRAVVVLIHGGFWREQYRLDLMDPLADDLARRGWASWNIEYRRVGPSGGGWSTTVDDVAAAIDHPVLEQWDRMVVIGHSAGGHLALWNAGRVDGRRPALTVGLAPVADVIEANRNGVGRDATANFFGGDVDEVPDRYHHAQPRSDRFAGRVVLIHGDGDDNVPVEQSTALTGAVDRIEVLQGVDHFHVIDPTHPSWSIVTDELDRLAVGD